MTMPHRIHFDAANGFDAATDEPLLISGLRAGYALPYECATGTCGSCRTQIIEGAVVVRWPDAPGLPETKRQEGHVLLCQALPQSDCRLPDALCKSRDASLPPVRIVKGRASAETETSDIARVMVQLDEPITFLAGQYALFEVPGVTGYRAYSMANTGNTLTSTLEFYIRRVPGGVSSPILLGARDIPLRLVVPVGHAFIDATAQRDILCVAGGTGLAPILSIARDALSRGLLRKQRLDLFIGVRTPADIFATASLQELIEAAGGAVRVTWAISEAGEFADWKGERGYVHEVVARSAGDLSARQVYMGGPPAMIDAMVRLLLKSRVKRSQIRFDKFA